MERFVYFKIADLKKYLRSLNGIFLKLDFEILIALTARKAYEDKFVNNEEMLIGFQLKSSAEKDIPNNDIIPTKEIGEMISRFGEESTLTDAVIGGLRNGLLISNPIRLQIKRYGLGRQANSGTEGLIGLLKKHENDSSSNERLIIYLEESRGTLDVDKIEKEINFERYPYKEIISIHYTKPDMNMHYIRLKPKQDNKYGYKVFSQDQVIT